MYPKKRIQELNRKRELTRRLKFVKRRIIELPFEYRFAIGQSDELPQTAALPPEWALEAARWIDKHCVKRPVGDDPRATVQRAMGMYEGVLAYLAQPFEDGTEDEEVRKAIRDLHNFTNQVYTKQPLEDLHRIDSRLDELLPRATPEQLLNRLAERRKGAESVVDPDGELQLIKTQQAEIYYLVWMFWPELNRTLATLTAEKLRRWLEKDIGVFTSLKTVEIVFARLKLSTFSRRAADAP